MLRPVFLKPFEYRAFLISPGQSPQHGRNTTVRFPFSITEIRKRYFSRAIACTSGSRFNGACSPSPAADRLSTAKNDPDPSRCHYDPLPSGWMPPTPVQPPAARARYYYHPSGGTRPFRRLIQKTGSGVRPDRGWKRSFDDSAGRIPPPLRRRVASFPA